MLENVFYFLNPTYVNLILNFILFSFDDRRNPKRKIQKLVAKQSRCLCKSTDSVLKQFHEQFLKVRNDSRASVFSEYRVLVRQERRFLVVHGISY